MKRDGNNSFGVPLTAGKERNIPSIRIPGNLFLELSGLSCLLENLMNQHFLSHTFSAFTPLCTVPPKRLPEGKKKKNSEYLGGMNRIQFQNNEISVKPLVTEMET